MITALSIVAAVLAVSALIVLHEAGHMWVARALGMKVEKFSVGFGPVLWSATRGETEYAVSALPLGGYVRIRGMAAGDDVAADDASAYCNQAAWRRVLVLVAGPGANYLIAVVLAAGLLGTMGLPTPDGAARVGDLVAGMPAERAGLRPGDRILAVAGAPVATWTELVGALQKAPGRTIELAVERGEGPAAERLTLPITPEDRGGVGRVGFTPYAPRVRLGPLDAAVAGFTRTNAAVGQTLAMLGAMVKRETKAELSGPVGIAQELVRGARVGADRFLTIVWNISVALALFNLLPFPALDGGRLVFLGVEMVTRRRVNEKVESYVHAAGFIALIALLLGVTIFGDLARLFGK
ncbi:MAG: site-2 protease family protein [Anaeromyxobacter sp.]|nr:site-2 protease family protein [Anaeromyxobacter sp.]MBL0277321.1 site-2 protease family protein [Anaeromyxobacter sp.]